MGIFSKIFTWWDGATIGTMLFSARKGHKVGEDEFGNRYFQTKDGQAKEGGRRWVIYNGPNDASRVPPEWHGWLHHTHDGDPESYLPPERNWEAGPTANLTGSKDAYRPAGALERGGRRAAATGDYQPWTPEAS
ncbi:MAG: NADH:ubiquinone oxidoreductase subunit NDUFA12 [Sphingorhabdus sp.]